MGDALKGKRLLLAAGVMAAVIAGVGAAAQAGLLSRAESDGETSRAAGAAVGSPETGDVIAVSETTATWDEEGNVGASATLLRVGDTKIGEAPAGEAPSDVLGPLLNGQPTEQLVDAGCDDGLDAAPVCAMLLGSIVDTDSESGDVNADYLVAAVRIGSTGVIVLPSHSSQFQCEGEADGALVRVVDIETGQTTEIDPSVAEEQCPPPPDQL